MVVIVETKGLEIDRVVQPTHHVNAPPPYSRQLPPPPERFYLSLKNVTSTPAQTKSWQTLPKHILLNIIDATIPSYSQHSPAPHLEAIYWLNRSLRLVSRSTYAATMHHLRSSFISSYLVSVKSPYTSDPFPLIPPESILPPDLQAYQSTMIQSLQRETAVLDTFIAVKCMEDLRNYESPELHLALDLFKDIFDLLQPKARTEDLIRQYGMQAGLITIVAPPLSPGPSSRVPLPLPLPLPFASISINFSPRKVGLVVLRRTIAEVKRERDESLESVAQGLIKELARALIRAGN
ncbi:hypothetical protein FRB94_001237 [Tulasnella sp. JGI-2019a]|nr:hypothetical protein FRB94_001237 [Tulasnella sp. JGI-2019a]